MQGKKATPVTLAEFYEFYWDVDNLFICYGSDETGAVTDPARKFEFIDLTFDSKTCKVCKITLNPGNPRKKLVASTDMPYSGTILDLLAHLMEESLASKRSGAI